jgi:hypothetical protein
MLTFWNPVCKKMFRGKIINSFHGMYRQSVYKNDKSVYLVKNNDCKCMNYFLISDSMINRKTSIKQTTDIFNDMKNKYPNQLQFLDRPVMTCTKINCCKNKKLYDLE